MDCELQKSCIRFTSTLDNFYTSKFKKKYHEVFHLLCYVDVYTIKVTPGLWLKVEHLALTINFIELLSNKNHAINIIPYVIILLYTQKKNSG